MPFQRAIVMYHANKYDKDESWYPKDPETTEHVDKMLYIYMGTPYLHYSLYSVSAISRD